MSTDLIAEARELLRQTGEGQEDVLRAAISNRADNLRVDSGTMMAIVAALRLRDDAAARADRAEAEVRERLADQTKMHRPLPLDDWHEDLGDVLWHALPIEEAPYCGTPTDSGFPNGATHWTPLPNCQWIMEEAAAMGLIDEHGRPIGAGHLEEQGIVVDTIGGLCPVQAEGTVDGQRFYFRARGEHWALHIGLKEDWFTGREWCHREPYGEKYEAGHMSETLARAFIGKAIAKWRAENAV